MKSNLIAIVALALVGYCAAELIETAYSSCNTEKQYTDILYAFRERHEAECEEESGADPGETCYNLTGKLIWRVNSLPEADNNVLDTLHYTLEIRVKDSDQFVMPVKGSDGCNYLTTASGNRAGCPITVPDDDMDFTQSKNIPASKFKQYDLLRVKFYDQNQEEILCALFGNPYELQQYLDQIAMVL